MSFTITREETYNLVTLESNALTESDKLMEDCKALAEEAPFYILNCNAIADLDANGEDAIIALYKMAKEHKGSILIAELADGLGAKIVEAGIQCLPTEDEAIDYIFMEQLESQLDDGEELD
jgi:hypothetical protein